MVDVESIKSLLWGRSREQIQVSWGTLVARALRLLNHWVHDFHLSAVKVDNVNHCGCDRLNDTEIHDDSALFRCESH
jgi:hypothetical protein